MPALVLAALLSAAPAPVVEGWKEVSTAVFSASLPGEPKLEESEVPTEAGPLKSRTWSVGSGDFYWAIAMVAYPGDLVKKSNPAKMLEGARDGAMKNIRGSLEADAAVTLAGAAKKKWPGREFSGSTPDGLHYIARIYLVDNELYQLIAVRPQKEGDDGDFKKIVSSFKLKPAAVKKK